MEGVCQAAEAATGHRVVNLSRTEGRMRRVELVGKPPPPATATKLSIQ
jgi:hypothetical protein